MPEREANGRGRRRIVLPGLVVLVAAATAGMVPLPPDLVERVFSLRAYPVIQACLTPLTNALPVALLDVLLLAIVPASIVMIVRAGVRSWRSRTIGIAARALFALVVVAAGIYLVFLSLWGFNYRRLPMEVRVETGERAVDAGAVSALGLRAVSELNALHAEAHREGWDGTEWRSEALTSSAARIHRALTGRAAVPGRLKRSVFGPYFRWAGVDAMINPLGLEVIVNPDLLPFERPFVAAHEWAHLAGFAHEAEANFVGFLTAVGGSTPAQYSGWLFLYWQVASEGDAELRRQLRDAMNPGPRADVDAVVARLRRGELPRLRVASWLVYDQYLKANRVDSGVRSYGEVIDLIVRTRFQPDWVPVRRLAPVAE